MVRLKYRNYKFVSNLRGLITFYLWELLSAEYVCAVFIFNAADSLQAVKMFMHHRFFTPAQVLGAICQFVSTIDDTVVGDLLDGFGS